MRWNTRSYMHRSRITYHTRSSGLARSMERALLEDHSRHVWMRANRAFSWRNKNARHGLLVV